MDTEGSPELREVAILDCQGHLIYEAFSADHIENYNIRLNVKPLKKIAQDVVNIARSKRVVCHYAKHDQEVLQHSFHKVLVPWEDFAFACTWELAKQHFQVDSYSLEHLSKYLHLKVNSKRFNSNQAHTARYDAEFTYQLYLKILQNQQAMIQLPHTANPFSSSRVDTPFQDHVDFQSIYHAEFELLKSILGDIKADPNQQSKGAIVIGEAGSGKTHLIMRMAKELLRTNRLLFIRQPNNAEHVLHHTYSRILESFAERVTGSDRTQLELLLANSFVKILSSLTRVTNSQKGQNILTALQNNSLNLYDRLGAEDTQRNRESWQYIERHLNEWWGQHYTAAGYSATILKGVIKFCSYSDPHKKDLVRRWLAAYELEDHEAESIGLSNWRMDISQEEFALEAITVFGKLSTLDEPLIIVFDQLESLGLTHNAPILESFGAAVKEILTHVPNSLIILNLFPDRWEKFKTSFDGSVVDRVSEYIVRLERPGIGQLEKLLAIKAKFVSLKLADLFNSAELNNILSQSSIRSVFNCASAYFRYKVNSIPVPIDYQPSAKTPSIESRVEQLEQVISQIANLIQPFVNSRSSEASSEIAGLETPLLTPQGEDTSPAIKVRQSSVVRQPSVEDLILEYLEYKKYDLIDTYDRPTIINDADEIGKLAAIAESFKLHRELEFYPLRLGKNKLPEHFSIKTSQGEVVIGFLNASGSSFTSRIKNFNQLVSSHPKTKFFLTRDVRESAITGAVGSTEIAKLNHSQNGQFLVIEQGDRVNFDLAYNMIIDIQEKDLEVDLAVALRVLISYLSDYWLISALGGS
jgi:DNA polymerase III epsilon subunit-like protein